MSVLAVCLPVSDLHNLHPECPQWMYFWEFYNSVEYDDYSRFIDVEVLCERGIATCVAVLEPGQNIFFKCFYSFEFKRGSLDLTCLALDGKALPAKLVKSSAPLKYLKDIYSSHTELCVE